MKYASILTLIIAAMLFDMPAADAARNEFRIREMVWTCSGQYHRTPRAVRIDKKTGAMTCLSRGERGARALTRGEANIACREQFHTMSRIVAKTGRGWQCRYYPQ